jgi:hypothetical protein
VVGRTKQGQAAAVHAAQIQMAPARRFMRGRAGEHVIHLAAAVLSHGIRERAADPCLAPTKGRSKIGIAESHVADHTVTINHQRCVSSRGNQARCGFRIHVSQRLTRSAKSQHAMSDPSG